MTPTDARAIVAPDMNAREVLEQLSSLGSEQTRKTWRRHGVPEPMFGVKYGDLEKLRKQIGRDHALAQALWRTGNHDARVLAAMIADPSACDAAALDAWRADATHHALIDALTAHVASRSPAALAVVGPWLDAPEEATRRAGWTLVSHLAKTEHGPPDSFFVPLLPRIERELRAAPNRAREAMNWALIAIGARSEALAAAAIAAAERIGPVEIDHGDTACKTPDAALYIVKAREHANKRASKKASKTTAKATSAARSSARSA